MLKTGSKGLKSSWPSNGSAVQLKQKSGQSPVKALSPQSAHGSKRVRLPFKSSPSQTKSSKGKEKQKPSSQGRLHLRRNLVR